MVFIWYSRTLYGILANIPRQVEWLPDVLQRLCKILDFSSCKTRPRGAITCSSLTVKILNYCENVFKFNKKYPKIILFWCFFVGFEYTTQMTYGILLVEFRHVIAYWQAYGKQKQIAKVYYLATKKKDIRNFCFSTVSNTNL